MPDHLGERRTLLADRAYDSNRCVEPWMTAALARFHAGPGADLGDLTEPVEARLGYAEFTARARRYRP